MAPSGDYGAVERRALSKVLSTQPPYMQAISIDVDGGTASTRKQGTSRNRTLQETISVLETGPVPERPKKVTLPAARLHGFLVQPR